MVDYGFKFAVLVPITRPQFSVTHANFDRKRAAWYAKNYLGTPFEGFVENVYRGMSIYADDGVAPPVPRFQTGWCLMSPDGDMTACVNLNLDMTVKSVNFEDGDMSEGWSAKSGARHFSI